MVDDVKVLRLYWLNILFILIWIELEIEVKKFKFFKIYGWINLYLF